MTVSVQFNAVKMRASVQSCGVKLSAAQCSDSCEAATDVHCSVSHCPTGRPENWAGGKQETPPENDCRQLKSSKGSLLVN